MDNKEVINIDNNDTKQYLEQLKKYTNKTYNINEEQIRLKKIINCMKDRRNKRDNLIKDNNLEIELPKIPNLDKINIFQNKLKIIEIYLQIISKLNNNNKDKAIEILTKKEFILVLKEFNLIEDNSSESVIELVNSKLNNNKDNYTDNKIKILEEYYKEKESLSNIDIPTLGLTEQKEDITLDNQSYFIN